MASFSGNKLDTGTLTVIDLPPDILHTHILTHLDGLTLASLSSTSSCLRSICSSDTLWRGVCNAIWPSTNHPRMEKLIGAFPNGHWSFFSNSFFPIVSTSTDEPLGPSTKLPVEMISAVDVRFHDKAIFSKIIETETATGWFLHWPFRVDLLDLKDSFPLPIGIAHADETLVKELGEKLTLSWIMTDPAQLKAANFSSTRPVSVQRHWLTGEVWIKFVTILKGSSSQYVECKVTMVTCRGEGRKLRVREVCMEMEDMEGKHLNGKESLETLIRGMQCGKRKKGRGREMYEGYLGMKRRRAERKEWLERILGFAALCLGISLGLALFMSICFSMLLNFCQAHR